MNRAPSSRPTRHANTRPTASSTTNTASTSSTSRSTSNASRPSPKESPPPCSTARNSSRKTSTTRNSPSKVFAKHFSDSDLYSSSSGLTLYSNIKYSMASRLLSEGNERTPPPLNQPYVHFKAALRQNSPVVVKPQQPGSRYVYTKYIQQPVLPSPAPPTLNKHLHRTLKTADAPPLPHDHQAHLRQLYIQQQKQKESVASQGRKFYGQIYINKQYQPQKTVRRFSHLTTTGPLHHSEYNDPQESVMTQPTDSEQQQMLEQQAQEIEEQIKHIESMGQETEVEEHRRGRCMQEEPIEQRYQRALARSRDNLSRGKSQLFHEQSFMNQTSLMTLNDYSLVTEH